MASIAVLVVIFNYAVLYSKKIERGVPGSLGYGDYLELAFCMVIIPIKCMLYFRLMGHHNGNIFPL